MITKERVDQLVRETEQREAAEKAAMDKELVRIRREQGKWKEEQERPKREAQEREERERRENDEAAFEKRLRNGFFSANPGATEGDYKDAHADLKKEVLIEDAKTQDRRDATRTIRASRHPIYKTF